jgi:threonine/homoserine/homoserine lactone efflux protein
MQIPYITAAILQLILNLILILGILYTLYLAISLIVNVRKGKEVDKKESIKRLIIYTLAIGVLLLSTNLFSLYDPFDIITNPKGEQYIIKEK